MYLGRALLNSQIILRLRNLVKSSVQRSQVVSFVTVTSTSTTRLLLRPQLLFRVSSMAGSSSSKFSNRLALEKSPYLLQHAHNPVDWYPWGDEAFKKAREEDKLIFLSVGYSTCHWCHVMERESFENEEVAKVMNENFVCVKVDREERPDVDQLYMTFVQASSGSGGWPMSVWLSPDLLPVFGGTYYPPTDMYGRPGFTTILKRLASVWREQGGNKSDMAGLGARVMDQIKKFSSSGFPTEEVPETDRSWKNCFRQLEQRFEPRFGGFSSAPKFPQPVYLRFLLHVAARAPRSDESKEALKMVALTLDKMAMGGIHDHVSQGFARYSTDGKWHVPHFEKMLYDQGQLCASYAEAYLATKDSLYADMARDIMTYVNRDLSHPLGGFYSAEDADSLPVSDAKEKKEGAFCVWTHEEIRNLLNIEVPGKDNLKYSDVFSFHYNVKEKGNVDRMKDPHGELVNQNVLIVFGSEEETANQFKLSLEEVRDILAASKLILHEARQKRPRPHLDDKMITSWNGLMISGAAKAGQVLQDSTYVERAIKAARFIRQHLYLEEQKVLLRSCYRGSDGGVAQIDPPIHGFLNDYAFLIGGLLDLYEACYDCTWLEWADQLQQTQDQVFWDQENGGYFTSPANSNVPLRLKDDQDGAEPSGNSISVQNLIKLSTLLNKQAYQDKAAAILKSFGEVLKTTPMHFPAMVSGLLLYSDSPTQIFITGNPSNPDTAALLAVAHSRPIAGRLLALADDNTESYLYRNCETIGGMRGVNGKAAAYVCRHHACSLPVTDPEKLTKLLEN